MILSGHDSADFPLPPIREIRDLRGKILAKLRDPAGVRRGERLSQKVLKYAALIARRYRDC